MAYLPVTLWWQATKFVLKMQYSKAQIEERLQSSRARIEVLIELGEIFPDTLKRKIFERVFKQIDEEKDATSFKLEC